MISPFRRIRSGGNFPETGVAVDVQARKVKAAGGNCANQLIVLLSVLVEAPMTRRLFFPAIVVGVASVALAVQAHAAASTATPPLVVNSGSGIMCGVTNVGTKPIEIVHQIVASDGSVANEGNPTIVAPGASYSSGGVVAPEISGFVYCRVQGFSSKKIRVTTCLMSAVDIINGSGRCLDMTTAP
jgi:hypothetical protein